MKELTLEKEFEIYKLMHKTTILQAKITTYFENLQTSGVNIPQFMQECPYKLAEKEVAQLLCNSPKTFETLYNYAWSEVAEVLP